jgi:hypothetical protein
MLRSNSVQRAEVWITTGFTFDCICVCVCVCVCVQPMYVCIVCSVCMCIMYVCLVNNICNYYRHSPDIPERDHCICIGFRV